MKPKVVVLVTSCGRRVQLLEGFRQAADQLGVTLSLLTTDAGNAAPASRFSDRNFRVPRLDHPECVSTILGICAEEGVDLLVPTIDPELPILSTLRHALAERGTQLVLSNSRTIAISADKNETSAFLASINAPQPAQWDLVNDFPGADDYPVIVKPRRGSMSEGVLVLSNTMELRAYLSRRAPDASIAQSIAKGSEFTVSTFVNQDGKCVAAVPRQRLEVRGGEVSKALTVTLPEVEAIATQVVEALPGARGPLNVQIFHDCESGASSVIEINARFGGGDPLAWRAGADAPRWILEEHLGSGPTTKQSWESGLAMLRFDDAVFTRLDASDG